MKCAATNAPTRLAVSSENVVRMAAGLLGFEHIREYVLLADPAEEPFVWLQVLDDPRLAFLTVPPLPLVPNYHPEIGAEDVNSLGLESPDDVLVLGIVTVRGPKEATMNLKGPILINRHTLVAKQVIPVNAAEFSVQHPLPLAQS
jgi:flagellar assembly factor FliW